MNCPSCGQAVDPGDVICPSCLANLTRSARSAPKGGSGGKPEEPDVVSATRREVSAQLLRLRFGSAGEVTVPRGVSVALGRDPATSPAATTLAGFGNISRQHAKVGVDPDGSAWVEDTRSMNGTFVNGEQVPPATRRRLRDGDELRLASDVVAEVALLPDEPPR
jgi:hypothetical protein